MKLYSRLSIHLLLSIIIIVAFGILLSGCASHIEDPDPSNFDLKTITPDNLVDTSISFTSSGVSTVSKRYNITIVTQHEKIDLDYYRMSGGNSSGVKNLLATSLKQGQTLRLQCQSKVDKGNLALVLLSPERQILHRFSINTLDQYQFKAEKSGIYFVRIGAESFSGEIAIERHFPFSQSLF